MSDVFWTLHFGDDDDFIKMITDADAPLEYTINATTPPRNAGLAVPLPNAPVATAFRTVHIDFILRNRDSRAI